MTVEMIWPEIILFRSNNRISFHFGVTVERSGDPERRNDRQEQFAVRLLSGRYVSPTQIGSSHL
jgi:hypothetical protein